MLMESVNIVLQLSSCVLVEGPAMKDNLRFFLKSIFGGGKAETLPEKTLDFGVLDDEKRKRIENILVLLRLLQQEPTNVEYRKDLSYYLLEDGNIEKALYHLAVANQLASSNLHLKNELANLLTLTGQHVVCLGKPACYLDSWLHIGFCLGISDNMAYVWSVRSITVSCFRIAEHF